MEKKIGYYLNNVYYEEAVNEINKNMTIFQKCSEKEMNLPCFCYHESLSIAGNCRMCLVEINTSLKLVVACAMPLTNGVKIYTSNNRVLRAREAVIEFILINHPLDCPICDRGGECDLQDITMIFGSDKSRYYEYTKRTVFDKECGPFVKTVMTRCIHCTRCVRFLQEIGGAKEFGMLGRGNESEVSSFIFKILNDEISANIIDLCPVGALTSKPYSYKARPWELNSLESIDIMDSMCSNVRIDYFNNRLKRILPVYSKNLNGDWITNKARYVYDSIEMQRLSYPIVKVDNEFISINWYIAARIFLYKLIEITLSNQGNVLPFSGFFSDLQSIQDISWFFNKIGVFLHINDFFDINTDFRSNFLSNFFVINLELKNSFIFIGFNPRLECPLINTRLRKSLQKNDTKRFFSFGLVNSYANLPLINMGNSYYDCLNLLKGKSKINKILFNTSQIYDFYAFTSNEKLSNLAIIFGISTAKFFSMQHLFDNFAKKYFNSSRAGVIFPYSGFLNYFELNNKTYNTNIFVSNTNFIYLHKVDERIFLNSVKRNYNNFVVYHGSHFDYATKFANLCLPAYMHFEENSYFLNFEGKLFMSKKVISVVEEILTVNEVFRLINIIYKRIFNNDFYMGLINPKILSFFDFLDFDVNYMSFYKYSTKLRNNVEFINYNPSLKYYKNNEIFSSYVLNYYNMDFLSRSSKNLSLAATNYIANLTNF